MMMGLDWIPGGLAAAFLLAFAFHRYRLGFILVVALGLAIALAARDVRLLRGAAVFGAPMLLWFALAREPAWRSRATLLRLLVVVLACSFTLHAPPHVFRWLSKTVSLAWWGVDTTTLAASLTALAALMCLVRWVMRGALSEWVAALVLGLLALTFAWLASPAHAQWALAFAAVIAVLGVLWTSYRMAFVDALTGLLNRRALDETLARVEAPFAIAMVDVDHFKTFNDTHGHDAGDVVLREVARCLKRHAKGRVFRFGGEEFSVLWQGRAVDECEAHAEHLRAAVAAHTVRTTGKGKSGKPSQHQVTISVGVALSEHPKTLASHILKTADQALYRAKKQGRNCVVVD